MARLNEEIRMKHEELDAKEGQLVVKELQMDQLKSKSQRAGMLNRAKEVRKLREKLEASEE